MATTYGSPVLFTKEKNVWILSARITFDANGVPALDTTQSKGFCAVWQNTPTFTAGTTQSSSSIGTVSSFAGLFSGMNITLASSGALIATQTIGSLTAITDSLTMVAKAGSTGFPVFAIPSATFIAGSGGGATGQYILQLGQQAATRLDAYPKVLMVQHSFDMTVGSMVGTGATSQVAQSQQAPLAPTMLWIKDNTKVRTVPQTLTSGSSDCSITVQFGTGTGSNFQAAPPAPGEAVRIVLVMGNSTAP